jgi:hypothetical protein
MLFHGNFVKSTPFRERARTSYLIDMINFSIITILTPASVGQWHVFCVYRTEGALSIHVMAISDAGDD